MLRLGPLVNRFLSSLGSSLNVNRQINVIVDEFVSKVREPLIRSKSNIEIRTIECQCAIHDNVIAILLHGDWKAYRLRDAFDR